MWYYRKVNYTTNPDEGFYRVFFAHPDEELQGSRTPFVSCELDREVAAMQLVSYLNGGEVPLPLLQELINKGELT